MDVQHEFQKMQLALSTNILCPSGVRWPIIHSNLCWYVININAIKYAIKAEVYLLLFKLLLDVLLLYRVTHYKCISRTVHQKVAALQTVSQVRASLTPDRWVGEDVKNLKIIILRCCRRSSKSQHQ